MISEIKDTLISLGATDVTGSTIKAVLQSGLGSITGDALVGNSVNDILDSFNNQHACKVVFSLLPEGTAVVVKSGSNVISAYSAGTYYLKEGTYTYTATLAGYVSATDQSFTVITAEINTTKTIEVELEEDTCEVTFTTTPIGATVVVKEGEEVVTATSGKVYDLKVGSYTYSVTNDGYDSATDVALEIVLADVVEGTKAISVELAESTCIVTFATTPDDATVVVTDSEAAVVAAEVDGTYNLIAGTYSYTVSKEGYTPLENAELIISAGDVTTGSKTVTVEITII